MGWLRARNRFLVFISYFHNFSVVKYLVMIASFTLNNGLQKLLTLLEMSEKEQSGI